MKRKQKVSSIEHPRRLKGLARKEKKKDSRGQSKSRSSCRGDIEGINANECFEYGLETI